MERTNWIVDALNVIFFPELKVFNIVPEDFSSLSCFVHERWLDRSGIKTQEASFPIVLSGFREKEDWKPIKLCPQGTKLFTILHSLVFIYIFLFYWVLIFLWLFPSDFQVSSFWPQDYRVYITSPYCLSATNFVKLSKKTSNH